MVIVLRCGSMYRTQSRQRTPNLDIFFLPLYPGILSHDYPSIIQHVSISLYYNIKPFQTNFIVLFIVFCVCCLSACVSLCVFMYITKLKKKRPLI